MTDNTDNTEIEKWKIKKLIKGLNGAKGSGTSMISIIISPGEQISKTSSLLTNEMGTASNVKSRVNRLSVLSAITSAQQRLKQYKNVPPNGLVLFVGLAIAEDGKEKKMVIDFEPFKKINTSLYMCDNRFHTEALDELLEDSDTFGFIIMDGNGTLYGTLSGSTKSVIKTIEVELPKKHGRGGQSSVRFSRLREEKRHNYVRKVAELATDIFITDDRPNVKGLILAGSAEFKEVLSESDLFDPRLKKTIIGLVDISYGFINGFHQAIQLSEGLLKDTKYIHEKKVLSAFFNELAIDSGKYCHSASDTMKALEAGAVETLIVWSELPIFRFVLRDSSIVYGLDCNEFVEKVELVEFLAENYKKFGTNLEIISDQGPEGSQFCKGFGGLGGILRWAIEFDHLNEDLNDDIDQDFYLDSF
jgi:peptide chain release factor subunit 1